MMKRFGYEWLDVVFAFCAFFVAVVAGATPVSAYFWVSGLDGCDLQLSAWLILVGFFAALGIFVGLAWFWGLVELGFLRAGDMLKRSARDEGAKSEQQKMAIMKIKKDKKHGAPE